MITVSLDPQQRKQYIDNLIKLDGLSHIEEDPEAVYCPISLTQTPKELKPHLFSRQKSLMEVLEAAGLKAYDPSTAPYSPDIDPKHDPKKVYVVDSAKIVGARFFVGHNIIASTGYGVEAEKSKTYNRVSVILMDKSIRVSRMQPHRTIYLQYDNFENIKEDLIKIFKLLKEYEPGMGFNGNMPVLIGFEKSTGEIVDLEELVYTTFPHLKYKYDGEKPILKIRSENPEVFYENR